MPLLNFRDPASVADPQGDRIRPGILFRSAQPDPVADVDTVGELHAHGIHVVVDLRSPDERGDDDWAAAEEAGITIVRAPIVPDDTDAIAGPGIASLRTSADLGRFYADLAASAPTAVADAVRAAAGPGAALLHCAAGKDRTGLLVALLLELAGVPDDKIADDYVRTATALPEILAALATRHHIALNDGAFGNEGDGAPGRPVVPAPLLQAPREAIEVFLETMRARHGSAEGFLLGCGVEAAAIDGFRAKAAADAALPATAAAAPRPALSVTAAPRPALSVTAAPRPAPSASPSPSRPAGEPRS
ncbi:tyrosine-protein phosphatase (plasmid) [Streptomyces sp. NBC_01591]|uniref:tyrosine-protein phosphatase n=1 Tax=Streptomyces sp. NBC_01591 TaxID=2975888 RepID=UPI002DD81303|nr:tyrosine-protein phosphatase [Streptomyces sp. NBC_01591]WSD73861.1 tyrosine-protein phosphatase [Streptomyces sp. NBC_01591]